MSYILDALKKSEQERGHGSVPGVQTIHSSSLNYHKEKKSVWPVLLFALVSINIAALGYFILTEQQPEVVVASQQQNTNNIIAEPVNAFNKPDAIQNNPVNAVALTNIEPDTTPSQTSINTSEATADEIITPLPIKQTMAVEQPTETINLHDMPLNVRQHIPAMEFSAHIYSSNVSMRSIVINGRFLEEGDSIANDLILSEITRDGAIFDFQGYRFSASVLSGWDIN